MVTYGSALAVAFVTLLILSTWFSIIINCLLEIGQVQLFYVGFLQNHEPVVV